MTADGLSDSDATPLDDAARAAWLYYVAGKTQDQIAKQLGISRQRAQRLVSKAMAEGLVHVRLEHRISRCMELESALAARFGLELCRVAPGLGAAADPVKSIAPVAAAEMERIFQRPEPQVIALSTGRTLRATVEELTRMVVEHHRIVSLIGNVAPDGSASYYDVIIRIADKIRAPHFPMPVPVIADSSADREMFQALPPVRRVSGMAANADVCFVGLGQMTDTAPLYTDGFISRDELADMQGRGAVGEIAGWVFDSEGRYISGGTNGRICAVSVSADSQKLVVGIGAGAEKRATIAAALKGRLINGLITDERTAESLI